MSADIVEICSAWQQAADAIDRAEERLCEVPAWAEDYGYELAAETDQELREAAVLVQRAVGYLRAAAAREAPRLEAIEADFEARGELPPWDRNGEEGAP